MSTVVAVLSDVCEVNPHADRLKPEEVVSFVGMADLNAETARATQGRSALYRDVGKGYTMFRDGDILAAKITPCWENGKVGQARLPTRHGLGSTEFHVFRPGVRLHPRYLLHFLRQSRIRAAGEGRMTGTGGQRRVPVSFFRDLRIPLPPLEEQRRIANRLDQVEVLRASCRDLLGALQSLPQTLLQHMFPASEDYPRRPISELTRCLDSRRVPVKESDRPSGSVPYYGANGQQGWIDQPLFDQTLVLVAEDGGHFEEPSRGVAYRIDGPSWVNNHAHVLEAGPDLNSEYLHRILRHYDFRPYISGSTRSKLTQKQLNAAEIPVPPLDSQEVFDSLVALVMRLETHALARLSLVDELAASIQANAFGKI